ncbi:MAG: DUF3300 domain-containing protein [Thalassotalea sp.]|nr:DUF3300 domain-containing protein [Thalassotalea sp.]
MNSQTITPKTLKHNTTVTNGMKGIRLAKKGIAASLVLSMALAFNVQADYYDSDADSEYTVAEHYSQAQLAQMLAPIALYPDTLLTHILIAASYPLEVVEAYRFQEQKSSLSERKFKSALEKKSWDESVKALVPFERVLKQMNDDLAWMRELGDAFLAQEEDVLDAVQTLRQQAHDAGSLDELANANIEYDKEKIIIVPNNPEVVYVPYYDTREVYGYWRWHRYPPVYWHVSHNYYHPISWHAGVHIGWGFFFNAVHWHNRYVVVNHHRHYNRHYYRKRHHILYSDYSKRWRHKPIHRRNVAYRSAIVRSEYVGNTHHKVKYPAYKYAHNKKRDIKTLRVTEHKRVVKKLTDRPKLNYKKTHIAKVSTTKNRAVRTSGGTLHKNSNKRDSFRSPSAAKPNDKGVKHYKKGSSHHTKIKTGAKTVTKTKVKSTTTSKSYKSVSSSKQASTANNHRSSSVNKSVRKGPTKTARKSHQHR